MSVFGYNEPQITEPRYVRFGLFAGNGGSEANLTERIVCPAIEFIGGNSLT